MSLSAILFSNKASRVEKIENKKRIVIAFSAISDVLMVRDGLVSDDKVSEKFRFPKDLRPHENI